MLAHSIVTAPNTSPERSMLVLHGILGTRSNWRGIARKVVTEAPEWGICLVDLRHHGDSRDLEGPDTVEQCALDLFALELDAPIEGVMGHSFGGKVALRYAELARERGKPLQQAIIVDSTPSARPDGRGSQDTLGVVNMLGEMPRRFSDRSAFIKYVTDTGRSQPLAAWLAMNLKRDEDGSQVLQTDVDAIKRLLADYFEQDAWPRIEGRGGAEHTHLVIGSKSEVLSPNDKARAHELSALPHVSVTTLDAGHWVHAEAPDALIADVAKILRSA